MQLRNDDSLSTVDHKRAIGRHERNFTHVNLLLLNLFHGVRSFTVHNHKAHLRAQRRCKRQPPLMALRNIECRLAKHEADKLQSGISGM